MAREERRPRATMLPATALGALVVSALVAGAVWVGGYSRSEVLLASGTAWLATAAGLVTLVDGTSESVIGSVATETAAGTGPRVLQAGHSALVVDDVAGTVTLIDGATYGVSEPLRVGAGPVDVVTGGTATYAVAGADGTALRIDPATLSVAGSLRLDATPAPGQAAVDAEGILWVLGGDAGGVTALTPDGTVSRGTGGGPGDRLLTVQGRAVLVDRANGRAGRLNDAAEVDGWATCPELSSTGPEPFLLGSAEAPELYVADPSTGRILVVDVEAGTCSGSAGPGAGASYGQPVEAQGSVLVPDTATGEAIVVDPDRPDRGALVRVEVTDPDTDFELVPKDGIVFFNEVAGPRAGVLRFAGGEWAAGTAIRKFRGSASDEVTLASADTTVAPESVPAPPAPTTAPPSVPSTSAAAPTGPRRTTVEAPHTTPTTERPHHTTWPPPTTTPHHEPPTTTPTHPTTEPWTPPTTTTPTTPTTPEPTPPTPEPTPPPADPPVTTPPQPQRPTEVIGPACCVVAPAP